MRWPHFSKFDVRCKVSIGLIHLLSFISLGALKLIHIIIKNQRLPFSFSFMLAYSLILMKSVQCLF